MGLRKWRGPQVAAKVRQASIAGINATMAQSVAYAKANHPWQNRTTTLEKGIRIIASAAVRGRVISGLWGVANVVYGKYLEASKKWTWLAPTAKVTYPRLAANIKAAYNG
jgi:integral membrane sensor domain MASE1